MWPNQWWLEMQGGLRTGSLKRKPNKICRRRSRFRKRARLDRQNQGWTLHFSPGTKHREGTLPSSFNHLFIHLFIIYAFICINTKHLLQRYLSEHGHFLGFARSKVPPPPCCFHSYSSMPLLEGHSVPFNSVQDLVDHFMPMIPPVE